MIYRSLGSTGIEVSLIGLGTVKFGRNQGVKYPTSFELPTDNELKSLLQHAETLGVNFLDTAPAYGTSEARLGHALKKMGNRSEWIISSKFGENFIKGHSSFDFSKKAAMKSIDHSLKHLQTDYIDLILVHSNGEDISIIQQYHVFDTLSELKKSGKIRAFGMSTKTIEGGIMTIDQSDVVMATYNPLETKEQPVIEYAYQKKKGVLIKKALASGHIKQFTYDQHPIEKSMNFILKEQGVSSIVIGTLNIHHLEEVIGFANNALK